MKFRHLYMAFPSAQPPAGGVAPTIVNTASSNTGSDSSAILMTLSGSPASGNLLVIAAAGRSTGSDEVYTAGLIELEPGSTGTIGTVTLDKTISDLAGADTHAAAIWSVPITGSGSITIRVNVIGWGGTTHRQRGYMWELSGADISAGRVNGSASSTNADASTTTPQSGNVTTGGAGIIIGALGCNDPTQTSINEDAAFSPQDLEAVGFENIDCSIIHRLTSSDLTDSADWTLGVAAITAAVAVAYKSSTP